MQKEAKGDGGRLNVVSSRLVFNLKFDIVSGAVVKFKSRLVARGFEDDRNDIELRSTTLSEAGFRAVLEHAVQNQCGIGLGDIRGAFLRG